MTIRGILLLAFLLAGCTPEAGRARGGIVSLNPCADQLLLALAPPERIAAISHYSRDPAASSIPLEEARRFRSTAGTAEEVIALSPDLVIATSFTPPATRAAFAQAGLRAIYLSSPTTIAASRDQVTELARAIGEEAHGAALNARIDAAVREAKAPGPPVPALLYISGSLATGAGTLLDQMMRVAGFRDAAADYGLSMTGPLPVETILRRPPAIILSPHPEARAAQFRHRLLADLHAPVREAIFPSQLVNCGGPTIPAALARLADIRRGIGR